MTRRQAAMGLRVLAAGGVVGPAAFIAAWSVSGARTSGYSATRDAISRLAALHAPSRGLMTTGLVTFGACMPLYGLALRATLPGPAWVPAVVTGAASFGVAAFPLGTSSDTAHGVAAAASYVTMAAIPFLAAGPMARQGRAGWARLSTAVGALSALCLLATTLGPVHGLFQRLGLTLADGWVMASACDILRRRA